jgi:hypothetical protein
MTTTAFQYVFNKAAALGFNRRAVVAQTMTRDNTVRTVSRGGQVWRFEITMPNGLPWTEARPYIEAIDAADRYTPGTVQLNSTGYNTWLVPYQGNATSMTGSWTQGSNTLTITGGQASSGYNFKAGDLVQLGSGKVYSVVGDVPYNSSSVTLNRPVLDATGTGSLVIGPNVTWTVICTALPTWSINARNQVSWNGSFQFVEALV